MNYLSTTDRSFKCLDEILEQYSIEPLSLNPHKTLSTSFADLGDMILQVIDDPVFINVFKDTLKNILKSIVNNFPENIFWDFDFFVISMLKQALAAEKEAEYFLRLFGKKIEALMELFGNKSNIHFRYLHDFVYGFDWARWVQKEPQSRHLIEPFNLIFLDYLLSRGQEILQLIDMRDRKYNQINDNSYRNPFCFSREPKDEIYLFTHLARRNLIPVATWDCDVSPVWNRPFYRMREALSMELNLSKEN